MALQTRLMYVQPEIAEKLLPKDFKLPYNFWEESKKAGIWHNWMVPFWQWWHKKNPGSASWFCVGSRSPQPAQQLILIVRRRRGKA
jgi:hypothetical protein